MFQNYGISFLEVCLSCSRIFWFSVMMAPFNRAWAQLKESLRRRVSNAALANAASVLSSKNWKEYLRWGAASKTKSKSLGLAFSLCGRAGRDAALVKV